MIIRYSYPKGACRPSAYRISTTTPTRLGQCWAAMRCKQYRRRLSRVYHRLRERWECLGCTGSFKGSFKRYYKGYQKGCYKGCSIKALMEVRDI